MTKMSGIFRRVALVIGIVTLIAATGCSTAKKKEQEEEGGVPTAVGADENAALGDSDSNKALGLQTIFFPYDSAKLDPTTEGNLKSNADILKNNPTLKVQIEGHCDQRGGIQYNIALGEDRAKAVQKFLKGEGIAGDRMSVISFGKEKPLDPGMTEEAYAKNRRANFVVTSK
jgi:peptidoglycan-associated lipoprotein